MPVLIVMARAFAELRDSNVAREQKNSSSNTGTYFCFLLSGHTRTPFIYKIRDGIPGIYTALRGFTYTEYAGALSNVEKAQSSEIEIAEARGHVRRFNAVQLNKAHTYSPMINIYHGIQ